MMKGDLGTKHCWFVWPKINK